MKSTLRKFVLRLTFGLVAAVGVRAAELRIGLIGLDTSHVGVFLRMVNDPKAKDYVPGGKIIAAFKGGSPDMSSSARRIDNFTNYAVNKYGVKLCDSIEELVKGVDAIIIFSVDGRPHLDQFRRTLGSGRPVFIDKPFAGTLQDAIEIVRLAEETKTPCFSSSGARYALDLVKPDPEKIGEVTAAYSFGPAEIEPHHPDLFWYGVHAAEALYTVLGPGCVQVVRTYTPRTDVVTGLWSDGRVGTLHGNRQGNNRFSVKVIGTKGSATGGETTSYRPLAVQVMNFFQTRIAPVPLRTTLEIFAFMEAADESKRRGGAPVALTEVLKQAGAKP